MDREELIIQRNCEQEEAAQCFVHGLTCQTSLRSAFKNGARWSDAHPRKGLVDIDEVCNLLHKKIVDITYLNDEDRNEFVENIRHTLLKNETEKNKEQ